jgi:hypothetical protein
MSDTNEKNLIGLSETNLDQPICRTYAKKWFLPIFTSKTDALRNPSTWDDPFENFFLKRTRVEIGPGEFADLESLARDWYGQCWTINSDTDAMWRIYRADKAGVQAKTTIRKLFDNLKRLSSAAPRLQFFVGRVEYVAEAEIIKTMSKLTFMDIAHGGQGDRFASLLCIKREAFQHEAEARLLFQDFDPKQGMNETLVYPLDPNVVFEEIVIDPRLNDKDAAALTAELRSAGCTLPIRRSELYRSPIFTIPAQ